MKKGSMKRKIHGTLLLALLGISLLGCQRDDAPPTAPGMDARVPAVSADQPTLIGKRLNNPFTIANMRRAHASLSQKSPPSRLAPNKLYVRFLPMNAAELAVLHADSLILSDIPLDVEVVRYGTGYNDPATRSMGTTWLYTTVDPGYNFRGIRHEVIDSLFLPRESAGVQRSTGLFAGFTGDDLEARALELAGYGEGAPGGSTAKAIKYRPKGYIRVEQSIKGKVTPVPVKRLKLRSRWWFDHGEAYTDENGYFEFEETYRKNRKVSIICIFENPFVDIRAVKGTQFWDVFSTERKEIGEYAELKMEAIDYTFANSGDVDTDQKRKWMCCHALNSVYEHLVFCLQNRVAPPPTPLNLWLTNANSRDKGLSRDAAAPMLKHLSNSSLLVNTVQLCLVASGHPWWAVAIQVLEQFPPDITYHYSEDDGFHTHSDRISKIFYHELAHASHYSQAGNSYWASYIAYIVRHGGYGDPSATGSGRIAISEAWAEFCASRFAHLRYGDNVSINTTWLDRIENFIPFPKNTWTWIPDGVMHDLTDSGEDTSTTKVSDHVSGYSISDCFGSLDPDIASVLGYKRRFIRERGSSQKVDIDRLFESYGYSEK